MGHRRPLLWVLRAFGPFPAGKMPAIPGFTADGRVCFPLVRFLLPFPFSLPFSHFPFSFCLLPFS
ncbi:MAG: hypothetical protein D6679_06015 [Candidatus Hydrogenedentota bacterium]|nr:MAG: hypothetical protein D6679_06015 [Candidatus Hydrogenedentota bacterium]